MLLSKDQMSNGFLFPVTFSRCSFEVPNLGVAQNWFFDSVPLCSVVNLFVVLC